MKYITLICVAFAGCTQHPMVKTSDGVEALQAMLATSGQTIVAKQDETLTILKENTTALAAIKSQIEAQTEPAETQNSEEVIPSTEDTSAEPEPEESQSTIAPSSSADVPLYVSNSEGCLPCVQLKQAVDRGDFAGFEVIESAPFEGIKYYPAIRYPDARSATGWSVMYGYNSQTPARLRFVTKAKKNKIQTTVRSQGMSQSEMVSLHNQLHGGGQWTWPGDLATHLQTTHGVTTGGAPLTGAIFQRYGNYSLANQRTTFRAVPRRSFISWGSRNSSRASCPSGTCP